MLAAGIGSVAAIGATCAQEPFVFSGIPIQNPKFEILVNEFGYSDSLLDRRNRFMGREYLSGEWAGAIYYEGGQLPAMTRWLTDRFVFPDFVTPTPHFTSKFDPPFMIRPPNAHGFPVYTSTIVNPDVELEMTYEMLDLGEEEGGRLALGLEPHASGGAGAYLPSFRYVFRHAYKVTNISAMPLSNVRFYQFLHTLEGDRGVYDGRNHGGGMPEYRFGITLQGESFGLDQRTGETVEHTDTVAMKYSRMPSGFEIGAFGLKESDSHQFGEPPAGVHKSVAANSLNGSDTFDPDGEAWVAGAVSFDLGTLAPGASESIDVLLGIHSSRVVVHPPLDLVIHRTAVADGMLTIDFEERTRNPLVGFLLRRSVTLGEPPPHQWDQVGVPYLIDVPVLNWRRFRMPVSPVEERKLFVVIQPTIINE